MSPPSIDHIHVHHPGEIISNTVIPLLLIVLGTLSAAAVILPGGHASQAEPQIAHLYDEPDRKTEFTKSDETPRKPLGQTTPELNPCLPDPPPQYYGIYRQAKSRERIVWLLVHEGDQDAMVQALIQSAERHSGYAVTNPSPFGSPSRVAILATDRWHQDHLDPLQPYGARPNPQDGDHVNASYVAWATAVLKPERQHTAQSSPTSCELCPTVVAVNQKPVGQVTDHQTKTGAWMLIGFAVIIALGGLYALHPIALTR